MWLFARIKHVVHSVAYMLARLHILNDDVCVKKKEMHSGLPNAL